MDSIRGMADRRAADQIEPGIRGLGRRIERSIEFIAFNEDQPNGPGLAQGSPEPSVSQQMREMHEHLDRNPATEVWRELLLLADPSSRDFRSLL
jgi:hypothetical protein